MNKADLQFLKDQTISAMRGEPMPNLRSPEFARSIRLVRILDEVSSPAGISPELRDLVLRQVGLTAMRSLLDQYVLSICAEADACLAVAASKLGSQLALESTPSARIDARGQRQTLRESAPSSPSTPSPKETP